MHPALPARDDEWKDGQIFSPKPQPASGGKGVYKINPKQRLSRLDWTVPDDAWKAGANEVEIHLVSRPSADLPVLQVEKVEAHLQYAA